ncbi:MAG: 4-hydroxy-3-methylbut-2-enyl diphosphate reductase [Planctomycetota bacterium]
MRIILAKTAGFCMGVKRAMEKVLAIARRTGAPIYTYGPLIHNRQVVDMLERRGIRARVDFGEAEEGTVLLRAHGVPPGVVARLEDAGLAVEDGTCPHVLRSQQSVARRSAQGYDVIIVGDRDHDEVIGLAGHAERDCDIIATAEEAARVPLGEQVLVVAQTTFNQEQFEEIVGVLRSRKPDVEVVESICDATSDRQDEARSLAREVDAMVVVGGYHSANTRRLAEIARATGTPTFHVEAADDLDLAELGRYDTVGVTAGASTPSWITWTVMDRIREAPGRRSVAGRLWKAGMSFLFDGNLYMAAGAAALTYAATKLLGLDLADPWARASLMIAAFAYIFSAYVLARRGQQMAGGTAVTRRAAFYRAHPRGMVVACVVFSVVSIAALVPFGWLAVALMGVSYAMSAGYGRLMSPRSEGPARRLRNVPASKDLVAAAGWTVVAVLVPVVAANGASLYAVVPTAVFVFGLAFIRSVMFDFSDVMADRLLGRETLPALIGVPRAGRMLALIAGLLVLVLAGAASTGGFGGRAPLAWWLLLCPGYVLVYLLVFRDWVTASERRCGAVADGGMLLAGLIALVYALG